MRCRFEPNRGGSETIFISSFPSSDTGFFNNGLQISFNRDLKILVEGRAANLIKLTFAFSLQLLHPVDPC